MDTLKSLTDKNSLKHSEGGINTLQEEVLGPVLSACIFLTLLVVVVLSHTLTNEEIDNPHSIPFVIVIAMFLMNFYFDVSGYEFKLSSLGYYGIVSGICISQIIHFFVLGSTETIASWIFPILTILAALIGSVLVVRRIKFKKNSLYLYLILQTSIIVGCVHLFVVIT